MTIRVIAGLIVTLVGTVLVTFTALARRLSLDDNTEWGSGRRLLLQVGVAFMAVGLWPALQRCWPSGCRTMSDSRSMDVPGVDSSTDADCPGVRPRAGAALLVSGSLSNYFTVFVFLGLIVSGLWLELDRLGLWGPLYLAVLLSCLGYAPWRFLRAPRTLAVGFPPDRLTLGHVFTGALILLPTLGYLALTLHQEFPYSGDHDHHLLDAQQGLTFWARYLLPAAAFWAGVHTVFTRHPVRGWSLIVLSLLYLWSWLGATPEAFARYPATPYLLSMPLTGLAQLLHWDAPLNANRLTSFLSLPVYLFVLRPIVVRRWPDVALLPFAAFFFFQKDVVYYFTTAYLEPWSVVFVLLAVEALVRVHGRQATGYLWVPPLLCGFAAILKEQAILLLPWIVVGAYLPQLRGTPRSPTRPDSGGRSVRWGQVGEMLLSGIVSATPFLVYYGFRRVAGVGRVSTLVSWPDASSFERGLEWAYRLYVQFGESGVWLWVGLGVGNLGVLLFARGRWRVLALIFLAGALTQTLFFYLDRDSSLWTGYPRFHLQAWALWGGLLLVAGSCLAGQRRRLAALALFGVIVGCQAPALARELGAALGPDSGRSYLEHYDSPTYYPIRALFRAAGWDGASAGPRNIHVVSLAGTNYDLADLRSYPDLYPLFRFVYHHAGTGEPVCSCQSEGDGILLLFWNPVGLNAEGEPGMYRKRSPGAAQQHRAESCLLALRASCQSVWLETSPRTGRVTGAVGTRPRR